MKDEVQPLYVSEVEENYDKQFYMMKIWMYMNLKNHGEKIEIT